MFVPSITDLLIFFKAIPFGVRILFALPWIVGLLSLSMPVFAFLMWKDEKAPLWSRILYILVIVASIGVVWMANFWNLSY